MSEISIRELQAQLLILEQIKNPSSYVTEATDKIKYELEKLLSQSTFLKKVYDANNEIEIIIKKYPELDITYSVKNKIKLETKQERIPFTPIKTGINIVTHINSQNQNYTFKNPRSFVFKNTEYSGVKFWKDVLEGVCNLIQKYHPNDINRILSLRGRTRLYFARSLSQLSSKEAKDNPRKIRNTDIYLETNYSANKHVQICYKVVELFEYNAKDLTFITY